MNIGVISHGDVNNLDYIVMILTPMESWCKIHTDLNVADPLTKPLSRAKHDQHQDSMGVRIITM